MRKHKIPEAGLRIINMPDLKKRLKLLLYLTALWGGPKCQPNVGTKSDKDMTVDQLKACCAEINVAIEAEDGVEAEAAAAADDGAMADAFVIEEA